MESLKNESDRIILGQDCVYSSDSSITGLNNNCLVVGTTGSGKTLSVSVPAILEADNKSLIITASKKTIVDTYSSLLKERGFDVQILNLAQPSNSTVGYDPLEYANSIRDINFIIRSLVYADPRKKHSHADPYFDDTAVSLGAAIAAYVKAKCSDKGFAEVANMIRTMKFRKYGDTFTTAYDELFEELSAELGEKNCRGEDYILRQDSKRPGQGGKDIKIPGCISGFGDEDYEDVQDAEKNGVSDKIEKSLSNLLETFEQFSADNDCSFEEFYDVGEDRDDNEDLIEDCGDETNSDEDDLIAYALGCWESFRTLPLRTGGCVYSSLSTVVDTLIIPEIRDIMQMKRTVNMRELANKKTVLFVITSPVNSSFNFFINLFYGHIIKELFEYAESLPEGRLPLPVHIICDDFATGGRINDFPEYISVLREKGISVTLLIQSESQLISMYGDNEATTILNNCDSYVYFGGMDLVTCKNISLRLNSPLEDVLYMPPGKEIVFRRGSRPVVTERYHIYEDERYKRAVCLHERSKKRGCR